jgi:hypothetical protein
MDLNFKTVLEYLNLFAKFDAGRNGFLTIMDFTSRMNASGQIAAAVFEEFDWKDQGKVYFRGFLIAGVVMNSRSSKDVKAAHTLAAELAFNIVTLRGSFPKLKRKVNLISHDARSARRPVQGGQ